MSLTSNNLIGYMRAEFSKAALLRKWLFGLQLAAALPAAISIVVPDTEKLLIYALAVAGGILLAAWCTVNYFYVSARSAANAARRGALLLGGLDQPLSTSEIQSLRRRFTVGSEQAKQFEDPTYYATKQAPGPARLAEMVEESAVYSEALHGISAHAMLGLLLLFSLIAVGVSLASTPYITPDTAFVMVRIFLAALVFILSSDVLGAFMAHRAAANDIKEILHRLMTADRAGYPLPDVLLAMTDYNAAIEGAPEIVPFAYKVQRTRLDDRWKDYQSDRENDRAARL
ncbi:hypothetical protein IVA86_14460 [Bradyrhizobium sp. 146]|uniref:hypothetical protein n=1 Tax=Bradyrhizobium sp. 146 TaxID=2782622 RepID=UPI001FF88205|nr:hypothetical protein [Bradyrhizobium sp. 146]MCK1702601.1 hypothetical protein [Bradyrhizobium sp. 146]